MLNVAINRDAASSDPLVLLHGFTQTGAIWGHVADALAHISLMAVDLPGHGQTPPEHDVSDLPTSGQLVGESGGRGTYCGYSLGARVALHLALSRPDLVERLIVCGVRLGLPDNEARARKENDNRLADRIRVEGLESFIAEWMSKDFNKRIPKDQNSYDLRLTNRAEGLASSLELCGVGNQADLGRLVARLKMPILVVVGAEDTEAFKADAHKMVAAADGNAQLVEIPGCGHAVPFERPDLFVTAVNEFLRSTALNK